MAISFLIKQKARKTGNPSPFVKRMDGTGSKKLQPNLQKNDFVH